MSYQGIEARRSKGPLLDLKPRIKYPRIDYHIAPDIRETRLERADKTYVISLNTLNQLVTPEGTYASTDKGPDGMYHGFFGRDDNISRFGMIEAYMWGAPIKDLMDRSIEGFKSLARYQGKIDAPERGEEIGKAAHEIRRDGYDHLASNGWYVDPNDHILKNWDTVDATSGRVVTWGRLLEYREPLHGSLTMIDAEHIQYIKENLKWILRNMAENDGLPAYTYNPDRSFNGLQNQGWKDSWGAFKRLDGTMPDYPITPVDVMASTWSALRYGEKIFRESDSLFADVLRAEADRLKVIFNTEASDTQVGFRKKDPYTGLWYYAEALEGKNHIQMDGITSDVGLALAYYFRDDNGEQDCIIDDEYMGSVAARLMLPDLLDNSGGLRIYSSAEPLNSYDDEGYHRGYKTIWPWQSGMVAMGLTAFGYDLYADVICAAINERIAESGSCVELYIEDHHERWVNPANGQHSTEDQAFTAGFTLYTAVRENVRLTNHYNHRE